jgi:hypothetical protein
MSEGRKTRKEANQQNMQQDGEEEGAGEADAVVHWRRY